MDRTTLLEERCKRLDEALRDACFHLHVMRGGLGAEMDMEYQYFKKAHKVDDIIRNGDNRYFEVGQLIAAKIPVKDAAQKETPNRYVGEIIRIEDKEETYIVSFDKITQKLAREKHKLVLDTPLATPINRREIWGAEKEFYLIQTYYGEETVKVVQFQVPDIAIVRYNSGEMLRVDVNSLKSARK